MDTGKNFAPPEQSGRTVWEMGHEMELQHADIMRSVPPDAKYSPLRIERLSEIEMERRDFSLAGSERMVPRPSGESPSADPPKTQSAPLCIVRPTVSVKNDLPDSDLQKTQRVPPAASAPVKEKYSPPSEPLRETDSTASSVSVQSVSTRSDPPFFDPTKTQSESLWETDSTDSGVSMRSASSMSNPPNFNLHRKQSCAVCEEAVKDPVRLPCGHWSCRECSHSSWEQNGLTADDPCKKCRRRSEREKRDQDLQSALLEKTIKRVETETEKFQAEKEKSQAEKEKSQAEKEKFQAEKEKSQAEKEKSQAEKEKFQAEKEKSQAEKEKFQAEKEKFQAEKEKLQAEKEKSQAEKEKFQAEKEKSQAEKEKSQAEKEKFQAEKEKFQAEKEKFELEKRKLALEIQSLEQKGSYNPYVPYSFLTTLKLA